MTTETPTHDELGPRYLKDVLESLWGRVVTYPEG